MMQPAMCSNSPCGLSIYLRNLISFHGMTGTSVDRGYCMFCPAGRKLNLLANALRLIIGGELAHPPAGFIEESPEVLS